MPYITLDDLKEYLGVRNSDTFTASADTDLLTLTKTYLTWNTGDAVVVSNSGGALPGGLAASTIYFVVSVTGLTIKLATSKANAVAGTTINLTSAGTGTHTITKALTDNDLLQDAIDDAVAEIESETGKSFEARAETRYYDRSAVEGLVLKLDDDLIAVTTLTEGDENSTVIPNTEYWLLPRNDGPPYRKIKLKADSDYSWDWTTDGEISVAGSWGFSSTSPDNIRRAVLVLAAYFYRQKDQSIFDVVAVPEAGTITIPQGIPATVTKIISKYQNPLE